MLSGLVGPLGVAEEAAYAPGALEQVGSGVSSVAQKAKGAVSGTGLGRWWNSLTPTERKNYRNLGIGAAVAGGGILAYEHYRQTQPASAAATSATSTSTTGTTSYATTSYGTSGATTSYVPATSHATTSTVAVGPPPAPLQIPSHALPTLEVGVAVDSPFPVTGGTAPYSWQGSVTAPGLAITSTGALSGTPQAAGRYLGYVTVVDARGLRATRKFAFSVRAAASTATQAAALAIPVQAFPSARVGQRFAVILRADGGTPPYTWTGSAAPGLAVGSNGTIAGTPTQAGRFPGDVVVTDATGRHATRTFVQTVGAVRAASSAPRTATAPTVPAPSVPNFSVPALAVGEPVFFEVAVDGGQLPLAYSFSGIPGLSINQGGTVHGIPTHAGHYVGIVRVRDSAGRTTGRRFGVTVGPAAKASSRASAQSTAPTRVVQTATVPASVAAAARAAAARQSAAASQAQAQAQRLAAQEAAAAKVAQEAAVKAQAERTAAARAAAQKAAQAAAAARARALAQEQANYLSQAPITSRTMITASEATAARTQAARQSAAAVHETVQAAKKRKAQTAAATTGGGRERFVVSGQ